MRLEKNTNGTLVVWETGRQENFDIYKSETNLNKYNKRILCDVEDFLRKNKEFEEADRIKSYLGKIIRINNIPELIPVNNYNTDASLDYLSDTINDYINNYGLDLNPDFQRHRVWTLDQRISYIEFILQGGKSNPIYLNCEGWMSNFSETMVIVDGKQRLDSLIMFLRNEFPVFKHLDEEGTGFYAKHFNRFGRTIQIHINDLPNKEMVLRWYLQINKGQVAHTKEEIKKVEYMLKDFYEN